LAQHEVLRIQVVRTVILNILYPLSHRIEFCFLFYMYILSPSIVSRTTPATICNTFTVCRNALPFALVQAGILPGISASTARPFSPPTAFRTTPRLRPGKHERTHMLEGRCHRCARWVPVQGVKDADAKVFLTSFLFHVFLRSSRGGVRSRNSSGKLCQAPKTRDILKLWVPGGNTQPRAMELARYPANAMYFSRIPKTKPSRPQPCLLYHSKPKSIILLRCLRLDPHVPRHWTSD
jgi:hypothetical protein